MPFRPQSLASPYIQNARALSMTLVIAVVFGLGVAFDLSAGQVWIAVSNLFGVLSCICLALGSRWLGWSSTRRWFTALLLFWIGTMIILSRTGGVLSPFWGLYMLAMFATSACISNLDLRAAFGFVVANVLFWIGLYAAVGRLHVHPISPWLVIVQDCVVLFGSFGIVYNFISVQEIYANTRSSEKRNREEERTAAAHAEKMAGVGRLVATTAHEMAQPVQVILTAGSLVRRLLEKDPESANTPEIKERVLVMNGQMLEATQRISRLLSQLKDFSRKEPFELEKLDMRGVLDGVSRLVEYDPKWRGIHYRIDKPETPLWIRGDLHRLEQVLVNLMNNACDAARSSGKPMISVSASRVGQWVRVSVNNNGASIPVSLQSRIFEPYVTTKNRGQGTGLGLTICDQLVSLQKGRILFSSEPDSTTFIVDLPALVEEASSRPDLHTWAASLL
jgi:signal transduction histidine kinase